MSDPSAHVTPIPPASVAVEIEALRRRLASQPADHPARCALAACYEREGMVDEAVSLLSDGLRLAPDELGLLVARGSLLGRLANYRAAEADLRRVTRLHPDDATAQFELGLVLWRKGVAEEAAGALTRAVELDPTRAAAYFYLAEARTRMGDLPGARSALARTLELEPGHLRACHLLGRVLDRMGLPEDAMIYYRRARELSES